MADNTSSRDQSRSSLAMHAVADAMAVHIGWTEMVAKHPDRMRAVGLDVAAALLPEESRWQDMSFAPRDGTHILAVVIEPGGDDLGTRDAEMVEEIWWDPIGGPFGESMPWRSGGYGHDGRIGSQSRGIGLVLCWMPIPSAGRLTRAQADARRLGVRP